MQQLRFVVILTILNFILLKAEFQYVKREGLLSWSSSKLDIFYENH